MTPSPSSIHGVVAGSPTNADELPRPGSADPLGPLPHGEVVTVEASAGTGKTWLIAAWALRYLVEEGLPLSALMIVTFTRAATDELRTRVRSRLELCRQAMATALADPMAPRPSSDDPVIDHLLRTDEATLRARLGHAEAALAAFDDAAISTIHGFCEAMMALLGILVDHDAADRLIADTDLLVAETTSDLIVARHSAPGAPPPPAPIATIEGWARRALFTPDTVIDRAPGTDEAADLVEAIRDGVEARKRRYGVLTFDDLVVRLRDALADPGTGPIARRRLRETFSLVLIDEFQDTDALQWEIVRRAFVDPETASPSAKPQAGDVAASDVDTGEGDAAQDRGDPTVILIGDPKQSIYGFRGTDVQAYLAAAESGRRLTATTNHRSSPALVHALNRLVGGIELGDPRIVAPPVSAAATGRLLGADDLHWSAPVRVRTSPSDQPLFAAQARRLIDADLVADLTRLLGSGLRLLERDGRTRPLQADDVAIIVVTNARGRQIAERLRACHLPVTFTGAGSVFASEAGQDWARLLAALDHPTAAFIRASGLTAFFGLTVDDLIAADEDRSAALAARIRTLDPIMENHGPLAVFSHLCDETDLADRLLSDPDGRRRWTDLRHLAGLLQQARDRERLQVRDLRRWLAEAIARPPATEDFLRRRADDATAIRMLTIHQAKGLEFPIVYLPQAADRFVRLPEPQDPVVFHDEAGRRVVNLSTTSPAARRQAIERHLADAAGESLRGLYVALTRASCQVTTWWVPSTRTTPESPLHRLLCRTSPAPAASYPLSAPFRAEVVADPTISLEAIPLTEGEPWNERGEPTGVASHHPGAPADDSPEPDEAGGLADPDAPRFPTFSRVIDTTWRRTSYSALTADAHHQPPTGDDDPPDEDDPEADPSDDPTPAIIGRPGEAMSHPGSAPVPPPLAEPAATSAPSSADIATGSPGELSLTALSPMSDLPAGTAFGSLVHAIYEYGDPSDPDGLVAIAEEAIRRAPVAGLSGRHLVDALSPGLVTPLGTLLDDHSLADIPARDRLAEWSFDLPLSDPPATIADIADLLEERLPADDPLHTYPAQLRSLPRADDPLRGFLTGSIDAVVRIGSPARHIVADYKTNRLGPPQTPLTLAAYTPTALADAMMASHYPLQALLYSVALHRFLRWRLRGYDPSLHLGGIAYLFVRGLAGPHTPRIDGSPCGVFAWRPPDDLVDDLSALLDGRRR
ncbi:MAG: UvrD-helicase domain-containing protein [Propionibacteriaceae bacterium]|jgi:exodeoxyribonuclease V beta subunit|nr:UvrD-helicase domain-containing protein [Propionibacteriaceae bacterium]